MSREVGSTWQMIVPLLILLALLNIPLCEAIIISPTRLALDSKQEPFILTHFTFGEGGQGRVSVGGFVGVSEYSLNKSFKIIVAERKNWLAVSELSSSWGQNYCDINTTYWGNSTLYFDITEFDRLKTPLNDNTSAMTFRIRTPGTYAVILLNCGSFGVKFSIYGSFYNVLQGKITHLPVGALPLPIIYLIFGAGVWPLILVPWLVNWYKHRTSKVMLHWLYLLYPGLQVLLCLYSTSAYRYISDTGENPGWLEAFRGCLIFATSFSYFLFRLLVSKGYGITRTRMSSQEHRMVFGVSAFVAAAETILQLFGGISVIMILVFYCIFYFYMHWNSSIHLKLIRLYVAKLREKPSTEQMVGVFVQKSRLIRWGCRVMTCFGCVSLLVSKHLAFMSELYLANTKPPPLQAQLIVYFVLPPAHGYVHHLVLQLIRCFDYVITGYLFWLRPIEDRIPITSHVLRRRELLERQTPTQRRQAVPSIMLENTTSGTPITHNIDGPQHSSELVSGRSRVVRRIRNWRWLRLN
ncbi:hypothetical protein K493DRAFT_337791 [Basidiobolus meristosporus CBS 931.73]|uniref:Uncharacterized protein n=1 Tax=Basidiobolus meristosporus CBS 931.73 TaxID=1314790 RepID=A0A1Y1YA16_9FUNG|nr:hypothetical protein K493DRAFT_337791 [Basidiobolus meristosporus CBS 931.73]|eukprot:ORX94434.1 hypothetical protein K493DRAFT_337791 [Basidiobolus meristosporus CBS 931.73]